MSAKLMSKTIQNKIRNHLCNYSLELGGKECDEEYHNMMFSTTPIRRTTQVGHRQAFEMHRSAWDRAAQYQ
jgi:hypothetical protein